MLIFVCFLQAQDEKSDHSGDDFEAAIREEVEAIKKRNSGARRFQVVESRTTNCVFIKTSLEHPDELVTKIFTDLCETQKSKSRFILKLHPVLGTCRAVEDRIEALAEEVLPPFLKDADGLTYCVLYKVRCNNSLGRDAVIQLVARVADRINPSLQVKFDDPDLVISVDILMKICCISVLKNFNKFKKYNVQEVVGAGQAPKKVLAQSAGTTDSAENPDAEPSEGNDPESVDVAESKDSKVLQDLPDAKSESKLELPSELPTLKATDAGLSERKDSESADFAESKDSKELQDFPDSKTSESKLELPSGSPTVKAAASCSDTNVCPPSTEQNSTEAEPKLVE